LAGNLTERLLAGISQIAGGLVGDNLLAQLKADMILQPVFQTLFGESGERIYINQTPAWNEDITPGVEFWWRRESFQSGDTYLTGAIGGHFVLPGRIDTKSDPNIPRALAATFQRFLASNQHQLFAKVFGLIEFGVNADYDYSTMIQADGFTAPRVALNLPFKFDLLLLRQQRPEIDYDAALDADLEVLLNSITVNVTDDNTESPTALVSQEITLNES
jgi:hypothetical protein